MARFVAGHEREALRQQRAFVLQTTAQLLVEQESRKFSGAGTLQELDEQTAGFALHVVPGLFKFFIPHEVVAVVVSPELFQDGAQLVLIDGDVHLFHLVKVGGVKPRRQQRFLGWRFNPRSDLIKLGFLNGIDHKSLNCFPSR